MCAQNVSLSVKLSFLSQDLFILGIKELMKEYEPLKMERISEVYRIFNINAFHEVQ